MKLEELEIENYKCLNNKGIPLKFNDLNILIGENDSGKTSLLEIIEIIFKQKDIKKTMFYDLKRGLSIKVKFNSLAKSLINESIKFQKLNAYTNEYLKAINRGGDPFLGFNDITDNTTTFFPAEYLKFLEEYNFHKYLKNFYKNFIDSAKITGEISFRVDVSEEGTKNDIVIDSYSYFDFDNSLKEIANDLVKNNDFLNFMISNLEAFDSLCMREFDDFFDYGEPLRFIEGHETIWEHLYSLKKKGPENIEWSLDKNSLYFKFIKKLVGQKLFVDDSKEMILAKIANLLSNMIHDRNSQAPWKCNVSLQIGGYWENDFDMGSLKVFDIPLDLTKELKLFESQNILDNYFLKDKEFDIEVKKILPVLKVFRSEVINEEIPNKLFDDLYGGWNELNHYIRKQFAEFIEELNEKIKIDYFNKAKLTEINNEIAKILKDLGEVIKEIDIDIKIKNDNSGYIPIGKKYLDNSKFDELFFPNIDFILKQGNQEINLIQKSQGFLRKILLTDFLLLLKKENSKDNMETTDSEYKKQKVENIENMVILIEEPELHLHYNAQKIIMKLIKENLTNSGNQVFVTSHSHFIIEDSGFENIYVFRKNSGSNLSEIGNILNFNKDTLILEKLQNSLGLKKTDLLFLKKLIVIVEGKNDAAFIRGLCKKPEYDINPEEILFVNAQGQANINYYIGLGDFLAIKVLVIFDNHPKNIQTKKWILNNRYKSKELTESIMKLIVLEKTDILNYLDLRIVENYFNLMKNSLDLKNNNLKDILYKKGKHINTEDVEFLASQIKKVDIELEEKIINIIKLFKIY